ncbi:hypothetical protein [Rugamonas sp. DEMB1]|uniref:hypothetical protein n=1 Tax=Rugamonas sp. DEMB1 TaxID=3039386 RepID=UPI00244768B1|nr:hypothetical protein [Rugamonas sp. DEMB1]WGG51038.1 hypothetical protein QC826_01670 [Rugamonas sp. DEMB1]
MEEELEFGGGNGEIRKKNIKIYYILFLFLLVPSAAYPNEKLPRDIRVFISNSFTCEHFAGEFGTELPKEQKEQVRRDIDKYCGGAKRQFGILKEKYKNNPTLLKRIKNSYNDTVDSYTK